MLIEVHIMKRSLYNAYMWQGIPRLCEFCRLSLSTPIFQNDNADIYQLGTTEEQSFTEQASGIKAAAKLDKIQDFL